MVHTDSGWISFQTRLIENNPYPKLLVNDSTRVYVKTISEGALQRLVDLVNRPDTLQNIDFFKLKPAELLSEMDYLEQEINPLQKIEFMDALSDRANLMIALNGTFNPVVP